MNEGADQPAGKTGSRRKRAGTKRWTELKKKKEIEKRKPIWRVSINSPRWRRNRRWDTKSGGMNGEKQTAEGKLTPLITSQHWPVLEVTFKVRTCVFLSILAPQNQVRTAAVTGRKDQRRWREKIKIHKRGSIMWKSETQECEKVEKWPKKKDKKVMKKQSFSAQPPTSSTSSCPLVCNTEVKEQMEIKHGHSFFFYFQNLNIKTKEQKRSKKNDEEKSNRNFYHVIKPFISLLDRVLDQIFTCHHLIISRLLVLWYYI